MSGTPVETPRQRLALLMDEQRVALRARWSAIAQRAGMDERNLRRIRRGEIEVTDIAARQIEDGLQWEHGSVKAVLNGGLPTTKRSRVEIEWDHMDEVEREIWDFGMKEGLPEHRIWLRIEQRRAVRSKKFEREEFRTRPHDTA